MDSRLMPRAPVSGGCMLKGVARRAIWQALPWLRSCLHDTYGGYRRCSTAATAGSLPSHGVPYDVQPVSLDHVMENMRNFHGVSKLEPGAEAVVSGRGKHLGIAVHWTLRWTSSGCFMEEIRGPQLTFKWGYDGRQDGGCWEVDSSGLVRVMECDDHEAVLMTTYLRTGCWLQPHLRDRFDIELLPSPAIATTSASTTTTTTTGVGNNPSSAPRTTSGSTSRSPGSSSSTSSSARNGSGGDAGDGRWAGVRGSGGDARTEAEAASPSPAASSTGAAGRAAGTAGGGKGAVPVAVAGSGPGRPAGPKAAAGVKAQQDGEVLAIGIRVRGKRLRVRALVRRRDWRLLAFDHRMCADVETWELGEWKEWATGVVYPSSALHKASNGGQHAYLTSEGAAERPEGLTPARGPTAASGGAAARLLPSCFQVPFLPPIPADTTYTLPAATTDISAAASAGRGILDPRVGGSAASAGGHLATRVPLWRAASGHFLVRPVINGQEGGGYFVLDTGASGFVITPQAAARLGGQSFGETHAASIAGKVAARFVRLGSWALGALSIRQPVLMVMDLEGLVRGAPGEVVGIVGHDLFRRAVVELPQLLGMPRTSFSASGDWLLSFALASGSGSESGSDDESFAPAGTTQTVPTPASSTNRLACGSTPGPAPPPSPPQSTPACGPAAIVFPEAGAAAGDTGTRGGGGREQVYGTTMVAMGQPVAAAAAPTQRVAAESPPGSFSGAAALRLGAATPFGDSNSSTHSSSSIGNNSSGSGSSRNSLDTAISSSPSSSQESSSSSRQTSGSASSTSSSGRALASRRSQGRSQTARAVRRAARAVPYTLHEMELHHPLEYDKDPAWVWHPLIMIANLPHVPLRFALPDGTTRTSLLMVDSGACGADLMLHARAQRELGLMGEGGGAGVADKAAGGGSGPGRTEGHYLRGVGQDPKDFVQLQVLDLPWAEVAGVRFDQVRCMCAAVGGLDISIYSHGILCGDLLARLDWAVDYTHKRIGFRPGALAVPPPRGTG